MPELLLRYSRIREIVGDLIRLEVPARERQGRDAAGADARGADARGADARSAICYGDLAFVESGETARSLAQVIGIEGELVTLLVFAGTKGVSTRSTVRFYGHPMRVTFSDNILGRIFDGTGEALDGGPSLEQEARVDVAGPTVNPMQRELASRMIPTDVPMIDVFNCLVESQKIPIFSVSGEPYNALLARIGIQADADVVVFGGMALIFDDYHFFRTTFEEAGVLARTVMYVNLASDPVAERILVPDLALAVAERFAVDQGKRVLVLLTDMTAFADALKEMAIAQDQVPSNRGYTGDLYSQLARRYERAALYAKGGSVTVLSVTTMPGDDVTHPVPDNTGYITEGQFYLHEGVIDPFGSLSRLKQHVVGKETREDHGQVMNTMIRLYAGARDAEQKQAMAFDLSESDEKHLRFGRLFRERFMDIDVQMPLDEALDLCWRTMAECFAQEELVMRQELIDRYYPAARAT